MPDKFKVKVFDYRPYVFSVKTMQICSVNVAGKIAGNGIRLTESGDKEGPYFTC
jgi:hypothetical protein